MYPIDRVQQSVNPARGAGGRLAKKQMLSYSLPAARDFFPHYPINIYVGGMGAAPPCSLMAFALALFPFLPLCLLYRVEPAL